MNRKGQSLSGIIALSVIVFTFIILLGVTLYWYQQIDLALTGSNIISGDLNYSNMSAQTIGVINTAFLGQADLIGIMFIFGIVFLLFITGYLSRNETPTVFLVFDIIILLFGYIIAVYMSNTYETILPQLPFLSLITENLNLSSTIMLKLPTIVVVIGILTMIITYAGIPKTRQEEVGGF